MPTVVPSWIDKVNYVIDYWQDPCHAPLLVYLQLARKPAGHALLTWFSFGLSDVLRGYLRPSKALGGTSFNRHGKQRKRKTVIWRSVEHAKEQVRKVPGIGDDIGNWIGKNLPGAHEIKGRAISDGEHFLWLIDDVSQRALLALLIVDVATDFLYEWATLLNQSDFCQRDHADSLYATGPGTPAGGVLICNPGNADTIVFRDGNVDWSTTIGGTGPGRHYAVSAMVVRNATAVEAQHYQQALVTDDGGTYYVFSNVQFIPPGQESTNILRITLTGPSAFTVNHCAFGSVVTPISHDVAIWGRSQ